MYAIVDIAGQQFKVEKDQKLFVHRLEGETGSKVTFEKVYLIDNDKNITVGDPVVNGASVSAKILNHLKGDKVLIFKKKRRKGYKKLTGHRQQLSQIQIEAISEKSARPAVEKAAETEKIVAEDKKAAPAKAAAKVEKKTAPKKETKEKAATKPKAATAKPKAATAKPKAAKTEKKDDAGKGTDK